MWHSGTLWFAGGETTGKIDTCHEQHMVDFCFYGVKRHHFGCKTQGCCWMKGNVFDVTEVWSFLLAFFLENIGNQQATS